MPFSRPLVQFVRQYFAVLLVKICHAHPFGQVLPDETVCILVGAPLPGMVRCRKVKLHPGRFLDPLVPVEFCPIVEGDREKPFYQYLLFLSLGVFRWTNVSKGVKKH